MMRSYLSKVKLLLLFSLFVAEAFSQSDYLPGSVIVAPGDTLYGEIDHRTSKLLSLSVKLKLGDVETEYYPFDIEGFRLNDGRFFVSRIVEEDSVFLEYLVNGKLDLYYQRRIDEFDCYYIQKDGEPLVLLPYYEEFVSNSDREGDGYAGGLRVSKRHIGLLKYYTQDAPELVARIDDLGKPSHSNLKKIVIKYNNIVCDECVVYQAKGLKMKIYPELKIGWHFRSEIQAQGEKELKLFNTYGFEINVKVPSLNERMYLKTGLFYYKYDFTHRRSTPPHIPLAVEQGQVFVVPLALEYMWPNGWFRPKLTLGASVNFRRNTLASLDLDDAKYMIYMKPFVQVGANVKLVDDFFLSIDAGYRFATVGLIYMY